MKKFYGRIYPLDKNWVYRIALIETPHPGFDMWFGWKDFPVDLKQPWETDEELQVLCDKVKAEAEAWLEAWETRLNSEDS